MVLCSVCNGQAYPAEELNYQGKLYHKGCFKCTQCERKLMVSNARSFDKLPYCAYHSPQTKKATIASSTNEPNDTIQTQGENTVVNDASSLATGTQQTSTENTELPALKARPNVLASGYDTFQTQIELAGQVFTVDPVMRQKILNTFNEFNIIVCGSARVGKSTLINAICGRPLAKTSPGLDSCTKDISRYVLHEKCRINNELITYTYNFWDTPGFESWNERDIRVNFNKIIQKPKSDPLCMIYCASPGSFADTQQLKWLLDVCIREHNLFCALVVTNKWAGQKAQRSAILNRYTELLTSYNEQTDDEQGVIYFGNKALCTMVNAQPYVDGDRDMNEQEAGVDELIEGIMRCLDDDGKVFHWCIAVIQKRGFMSHFKGKMRQSFANIQDFLGKKFMTKKK